MGSGVRVPCRPSCKGRARELRCPAVCPHHSHAAVQLEPGERGAAQRRHLLRQPGLPAAGAAGGTGASTGLFTAVMEVLYCLVINI